MKSYKTRPPERVVKWIRDKESSKLSAILKRLGWAGVFIFLLSNQIITRFTEAVINSFIFDIIAGVSLIGLLVGVGCFIVLGVQSLGLKHIIIKISLFIYLPAMILTVLAVAVFYLFGR